MSYPCFCHYSYAYICLDSPHNVNIGIDSELSLAPPQKNCTFEQSSHLPQHYQDQFQKETYAPLKDYRQTHGTFDQSIFPSHKDYCQSQGTAHRTSVLFQGEPQGEPFLSQGALHQLQEKNLRSEGALYQTHTASQLPPDRTYHQLLGRASHQPHVRASYEQHPRASHQPHARASEGASCHPQIASQQPQVTTQRFPRQSWGNSHEADYQPRIASQQHQPTNPALQRVSSELQETYQNASYQPQVASQHQLNSQQHQRTTPELQNIFHQPQVASLRLQETLYSQEPSSQPQTISHHPQGTSLQTSCQPQVASQESQQISHKRQSASKQIEENPLQLQGALYPHEPSDQPQEYSYHTLGTSQHASYQPEAASQHLWETSPESHRASYQPQQEFLPLEKVQEASYSPQATFYPPRVLDRGNVNPQHNTSHSGQGVCNLQRKFHGAHCQPPTNFHQHQRISPDNFLNVLDYDKKSSMMTVCTSLHPASYEHQGLPLFQSNDGPTQHCTKNPEVLTPIHHSESYQ